MASELTKTYVDNNLNFNNLGLFLCVEMLERERERERET